MQFDLPTSKQTFDLRANPAMHQVPGIIFDKIGSGEIATAKLQSSCSERNISMIKSPSFSDGEQKNPKQPAVDAIDPESKPKEENKGNETPLDFDEILSKDDQGE